jgi:hypothetical protein
MVDRALGVASVVEPVRPLLFGSDPVGSVSGYEGSAIARSYGDDVIGTSITQSETSETPTGFSNTPSVQVGQGDALISSAKPLAEEVHDQQSRSVATSTVITGTVLRQEGQDGAFDLQDHLHASQVLRQKTAIDEVNRVTESQNSYQHNSNTENVSVHDEGQLRLIDTVASNYRSAPLPFDPVNQHTQQTADCYITKESKEKKEDALLAEKSPEPQPLLRPRDLNVPSILVQDVSRQLSKDNPQPSQPTIQVTIGRIEVRAVEKPSAPQSSKSKKTRPSLSLDDYLKQRAGGEQ